MLYYYGIILYFIDVLFAMLPYYNITSITGITIITHNISTIIIGVIIMSTIIIIVIIFIITIIVVLL